MIPPATRLLTRWGEQLDAERPLPEYPRPQMRRESYVNLNGIWEHAFRIGEQPPAQWDGPIIVPFSPEAPLSGVDRQLQPGEFLHYRRAFELPDGFVQDRVLLHFGAVDQWCRVRVNGHEIGTHEGGYLPFTFDITDALIDGPNVLHVVVTDPSDTGPGARGKQALQPGGIWYTAQSGIWQTVWLESVPDEHVTSLRLEPDLTGFTLTVHASGSPAVTIRVLADGQQVLELDGTAGTPMRVDVPDPRQWSPEDPYLYDIVVCTAQDRVHSYVGLRTFGVGPDDRGIPRLLLNGEPYFHAGVLDQGYWSDGLYTAPSDDALIFDIQTMKDIGFTMLRKHIKVEPLRWYYHCDRLGMLVWQDMVNGGDTYRRRVVEAPAVISIRRKDHRYREFARADGLARSLWLRQAEQTVATLFNCTGLAVWVPFNEGWGQFDANQVAERIRVLDPSRPIDHASGWHDQGGGDFRSLHVYFRTFRVPKRRGDTRVLALSEYGGYSLPIAGHTTGDKPFGYRRFTSEPALTRAFIDLHDEQVIPTIPGGLSATVYTQLSDVEDETNGLLTYDRRVLKMPAALVRPVISRMRL